MPRAARLVFPGLPHHVTQRGNRRHRVFFCDRDYLIYLHWLREYAGQCGVEILAYALMPNHVHLVLVPEGRGSLPEALRCLHMRYAQRVNREKDWVGHLWQGRYFSSVVDERYFWAAIHYVERNPVRAGLVERAEDYHWSSARAHCGLREDPVLTGSTRWQQQLDRVANWSAWLAEAGEQQTLTDIRVHTLKGLPCGGTTFVESLERDTGRVLRTRPPGRPAARK